MRLLIVVASMSIAFGSDWPQWRGPHFNGTSDETNLPASLDSDTLLWKTPLPGVSAATPVIVGGRIYLPSTENGSKRLLAMCLDASTGKNLWQHATTEANQTFPLGNTMASCSPCADETGAIFLFAEGTLVKLSPEGQTLWDRNIVDEYGPLSLKFGYGASPLHYDGKLYLTVLRRGETYRRSTSTATLDSYLLCVDPTNGKTLYKHTRPTDAENESTNAYNTPIPATFNGQPQIIVCGGDYLTAHNPADGSELWRYLYADPRGRMGRLIPTPVVDGNRIYCTYPVGLKTFAVELGKDKDPSQVWVYDQKGPDASSPTLYNGYLYQINEAKKTLTCLDAKTGQAQWIGQLSKGDLYYASITAADDKLYLVNRDGEITVAAADPMKFRILSTWNVGESPVDSSIIIVNGKVYLRTAENLYCFSTAKSK